MTKREIRHLLTKYKKEISKGDKTHIKDSIALMVLWDLSLYNNSIENIDVDNTTLKTLMLWGPRIDKDIKKSFIDTKSGKYVVPTIKDINIIKGKYKKGLEKTYKPYNYENENAATTWIEMMLTCGMLEEGQIIDLDEIKYKDFITDDNLKALFDDTREMSIRNYILQSKKLQNKKR